MILSTAPLPNSVHHDTLDAGFHMPPEASMCLIEFPRSILHRTPSPIQRHTMVKAIKNVRRLNRGRNLMPAF
jgi:hypothetical protein